jgi:hypothetical protein
MQGRSQQPHADPVAEVVGPRWFRSVAGGDRARLRGLRRPRRGEPLRGRADAALAQGQGEGPDRRRGRLAAADQRHAIGSLNWAPASTGGRLVRLRVEPPQRGQGGSRVDCRRRMRSRWPSTPISMPWTGRSRSGAAAACAPGSTRSRAIRHSSPKPTGPHTSRSSASGCDGPGGLKIGGTGTRCRPTAMVVTERSASVMTNNAS